MRKFTYSLRTPNPAISVNKYYYQDGRDCRSAVHQKLRQTDGEGGLKLRNVEECISAARRERARRHSRKDVFEERYFGEPAWNILLEVFILTVEGHSDIMMKHLAGPSQAPPTTFLRYVDWLESQGDLVSEKTDRDKRYRLIRLSQKGRQRIEHCLTGMIREEERFIAPNRFDLSKQLLPDRCFEWVV